MEKRVVITGMGILSAMGRGMEATAESITSGKSCLSKIENFNSAIYASPFGGVIRDKDIENMTDGFSGKILDKASHILYTVISDALADSGIDVESGIPRDISIFLGTTLGGMLNAQKFHSHYLTGQDKDKRARLTEDYLPCSQAYNIAKRFNLSGEPLIINNACASGVNSIGLAFNRISRGVAQTALAGGYDVMSEFTYAGFNSLQLVTAEKCRPFDKNRSGLVLGEGAGVLVLEDLEQARKRNASIIAEIKGFGQTTDAYHLTKPDPEARGAAMSIKTALNISGLDPSEIDYINAHGTGTAANDPMESRALKQALGKHSENIPVSSTKPFAGHMLGGAGAVETIISAIAIKKNILPPNLNYETPDNECPLNIVTGRNGRKDIKTVLSNSFGFGGSNGTIILQEIND